jgi:GWxTD domain-containing protein
MGSNSDFLLYLSSLSIRSLGLASLAWVAMVTLRVKSSSARHAVWTVITGWMLLQIVARPLLPAFPVRILAPAPDAGSGVSALVFPPLSLPDVRSSKHAFAFPSWQQIVIGVYAAVALVLLVRMALAYRFTRILLRGSKPITDLTAGRRVRFHESGRISVPMTVGYFTPAVLLPMGWRTWDRVKLQAVIAHEEAHIRRADWAIGLIAGLNCCVFWFHPLAWWLKKELASLAEFACDDTVLRQAGDCRQYAQTLLEITAAMRSVQGRVIAASMVKESNVQKRLNRILDESRSISANFGRRGWVVLLLGSLPVAYFAWAVQLAPAQIQVKPQPSKPPANAPRVKLAQAQGGPAAPAQPPAPTRPPAQAQQNVPAQPPVTPAAIPESQFDRWQRWANGEVTYIISDAERIAFRRLQTDDEREMFIKQFWLRRDPTPGTEENEMKEEHYRRIAFANDRFSAGIPGWKTDRGAVYIKYGPPDALDTHGATPEAYPYEIWHYRNISGFGANADFEFVDPTMTGRYHLTLDPTEKERTH